MNPADTPTVLIVPGLRDAVADHWQTLLAERLPRVRTMPPMGREDLDCAARVTAIEREAQAARGPLIWGSTLVDLGEIGHPNPASGHGPKPHAESFIAELAARPERRTSAAGRQETTP